MCRNGKIWPTAGALYTRSRAAPLDRRDRLEQEAVVLVARTAAGHADLLVGARLDRRPRLDRVSGLAPGRQAAGERERLVAVLAQQRGRPGAGLLVWAAAVD